MKRKILVVDDDKTILEALRMTLEDEGYDVETSPNGQPLEHINGQRPDVIVLDIMLEGQDGRQLLRRLKDRGVTVPVIMISAMSGARDSALEAGADQFLEKPFDLDDLLDAARKHTQPTG